MYPLFLRLEEVPVLVVGGGKVAERKARRLVESRARVTLVSPDATPALRELAEAGSIRWLRRPFHANDTQGYRLVFAATDQREVNERIAEEAERAGIWANVADSPDASTFLVPATVRRGALTLAVATEGASPLVSRLIREELERRYGEEYGVLLELLAAARERAARSVPTQAVRQRLYAAILAADVLDLIRSGRRELAEERIRELIARHRGIAPGNDADDDG